MEKDLSLTRKIQALQLDILAEFKKICERHKLRYFAIGGTCIGAIRHAGFIPWDDDIDVAMPLEDYIKFRAIAKNELTAPFELYDPQTHVYNKHNFLKVHNVNTAFIEAYIAPYPDRHTGVYVDVFPLYALPKGKRKMRRALYCYGLMLKKNRCTRLPLGRPKSIMSKIIFLTTHFKRKAGDYNYYLKKLEERFSKYSFEEAEQILFAWRETWLWPHKARYNRMVFPKRAFAAFKEAPFENTTIRVPIGYDEYLRQDFGDYMKLPPEEERVSVHPAAVIDLEKSYLEYAEELGKK